MFDPVNARRYASPNLYRPTVDGIVIVGSESIGDLSKTTTQIPGSPAVRKSSDRANDFVMLADELHSSRTFVQSVAAAKQRLVAKGGGRIRYPRGGFDVGTQAYAETETRVVHEGEASTLLYSSNPNAPLFTFGSSAVSANRSGLANIQLATTVVRTAPLVRIVNAYEPILDTVEASASAACPVAFDIDGGVNSYNNRLDRVRTFGPFGNAVRVGKTARVQGLYLGDGWSFGGTTDSAILMLDVSGVGLGKGEGLACLRGLEARPGVGQVVLALQIGSDVLFDTCVREGLLLADAGGYIESVTSSGLWCCSNGNNNNAATKYSNILISASALGNISGVRFLGGIFGNAANHGVITINADDVHFISCLVNGNGAGGSGSGYFIGNGSRHVKIDGGSARGAFSRRSPFGNFQQYGVLVDVDTDYISVLNRVDMTGTTAGAVSAFSSGTNNSYVSGSGYYR